MFKFKVGDRVKTTSKTYLLPPETVFTVTEVFIGGMRESEILCLKSGIVNVGNHYATEFQLVKLTNYTKRNTNVRHHV